MYDELPQFFPDEDALDVRTRFGFDLTHCCMLIICVRSALSDIEFVIG